jgi:phage shock protein A
MGLFKRLKDIFTANLGEAIDACEDPEMMLKQAIREMEEAIVEARRETAKAMAAEKLAGRDLADSERHARDLQLRAEQAVRAGDDGLARTALGHKQEQEKTSAALREQASASAEASGALRRQLEGMQDKLAEAKRRLGTLTARQKAASVRMKSADPAFETAAFDTFDRISEKVARAEAEAEAMSELHACRRGAASSEVAVDGAGSDVEAELAELKKKAGK